MTLITSGLCTWFYEGQVPSTEPPIPLTFTLTVQQMSDGTWSVTINDANAPGNCGGFITPLYTGTFPVGTFTCSGGVLTGSASVPGDVCGGSASVSI
jgi:hypothetical protein